MPAADDVLVVGDASGSKHVRLGDYLNAELAEQAEREANAWVKSLRGVAIDGVPFRDRFTHRGDSLWWFAELYLHKMQVANHIHRTLLALEALVQRERPTRIGVVGGNPYVGALARRVAERNGIEWLGGQRPGAPLWWKRLRVAWRAQVYMAGTAWANLGRSRRHQPPRAAVAAFVHAAFWRGREEQYVGPVLLELGATLPAGDMALVGLGPETSYRARTWHHRFTDWRRRIRGHAARSPVEAFSTPDTLQPSRDVWRGRRATFAALTGSLELRRAAVIKGCDTWPLLEPIVAGIAYLQFPWSACVMDQLGAALDAIQPSVAVTYAEAGGWGRALVLEARRRGISTVGLQHGFIYRHWLNYLHEADEMVPSAGNPVDRGFPCPTLTLLFDDVAAEHLERAGRYPRAALDVTGSARLDALVRRASAVTPDDMGRVRRAVGAEAGQAVIVVAAKFSQISHVFPQLVDAVNEIPGVRLVIKPHPAETSAPYLAAARHAPHVAAAPGDADLADLTRIARLLVTVNSTAAIEAMVMGVPSLVLAMPNNLTPFVAAGAMSGVFEGDPIGPVLRSLLMDEHSREAVLRRSEAFMQRYRVASDGGAARRAAEHIVRLASTKDQPKTVS